MEKLEILKFTNNRFDQTIIVKSAQKSKYVLTKLVTPNNI